MQQAAPLPTKSGELGFIGSSSHPNPITTRLDLPSRHPADHEGAEEVRDHEVLQLRPVDYTKPLPGPSAICGLRRLTLSLLFVQILLLGGTGVGWFFAFRALSKTPNANSIGSNDGQANSTTMIFVHVAFAVTSLAQLFFLERRIYCLRAERYAYTHPGEILPTTTLGRRNTINSTIALAPWNRPPLPTYASVLVHSGVSTGDVEDNVIAVPPPPAYHNPAKTKMLMQGHLRDSLRLQRPVSVHSQSSVYEIPPNIR